MRYYLYDPKPTIHDYLSPLYFDEMEKYGKSNGIEFLRIGTITEAANCIFICNADYLDPVNVSILKNNGCKIVGFSVTDSSYVSQACRAGFRLKEIDLMFMLTGLQNVNHGHEMIVNKDFKIELEPRQFLPSEDWEVFNSMRVSGRLQSLPYVHAERQPHVEGRPYSARSQKALIRGGHHMRRFILALKLMEIDRLDTNSGFVTEPYFQDSMNPQFRYCDLCRAVWKNYRAYPYMKPRSCSCKTPPVEDLGQWNNVSPAQFYGFSEQFGINESFMPAVSKLLNARWLTQQQHLEMLARITFTSDLKWLFSIYTAQRFWDAAMVGCVNLLPLRTAQQDYFPKMEMFEHYWKFNEDLNSLEYDCYLTEVEYSMVSRNAKALYDDFMRPTDYRIGTPILKNIFDRIQEHTE